ncbi:MAG: putative RNA uridine N3 methyltransferase [Nitrososphaeria archaeon]
MVLSVFIPDSILCEDKSLRDKTVKLGLIARACSIFKVEKIYIYTDEGGTYEKEYRMEKLILEYAETPQYLRRHLFPMNELLREVGVLPPLKTPSHKPFISLDALKVGDVREGVLVKKGGLLFADIGLSSLVKFVGRGVEGERSTVYVTEVSPIPTCRPASSDEIKEYWGYRVVRVGSIGRVLKRGFSGLKIIASRLGQLVNEEFNELASSVKSADSVAIVFGSPNRGLYDILKDEGLVPEDVADFVVNFVPGQGTATIRSEEAIFISLSIVYLASNIGR